jgi:glycosyltransferase involved in cell wall biosynthesis
LDSANKSHGSALQILVVADAFPKPDGGTSSWHALQILRALRMLGHDVTLVIRENLHRIHYEPALQELGIRIFAGDKERLASLGIEAHSDSSWTLQDVMAGKNFFAAFLLQNFNRGISVPEHYLDDLRRCSPRTRIAAFCDNFFYVQPVSADKTKLQDLEVEVDRRFREREFIERADLVVVSRAIYAFMSRDEAQNLGLVVLPANGEVSDDFLADQLTDTLAQLSLRTPKPRVQQAFSVMQIETLFAERLSDKTGEQRILRQLESYARIAGKLLSEAKPADALDQLRHIFSRTTGVANIQADEFYAQVFVLLKRCYRELNQPEMAERCATEARKCAMLESGGAAKWQGFAKSSPNRPQLSVIVPTYNRLPILKKCLAALEAQTLPAQNFEVIVIDDGSSDGTEEFMRQYTGPFQLQYLRQKNSGTGAARCNGVAHATGEYLLLMNDDTICDRDVAEQHLRVQHSYPGERWAVLGNFEYPAAARERALTHYFRVEPFMFPQVNMEEGCPYGYSYFITCNLSVRRDAVIQAGSFHPTYKLSEDTEMGLRLHERGYRVLYHPSAHAWHDHLPYPARNLIRRARVYGADYFYMFRNHPRVMQEWAMPIKLTGMDEENALRVREYVNRNRLEIEDAVIAIERWDTVDFEPILTDQPETAAMILGLFRQAVPAIHWFYLFETMLHTMAGELNLPHLDPERQAIAQGAP